ncbi:MAG: class I SAM-dependent methyltransferase [Planctomycetota bacterium]
MAAELTLEGAAFLASERAQRELAALAEEGEPLARLEALRRAGWSPTEAGWLVEQAELRRRARPKLPDAERLLLLREALEQASAHEVAAWRAARLVGRRVLEVGAGIGGDTIALARAGCRVVACERDPVRAALLRHNLAALELSDRVEVREEDGLLAEAGEVDAIYADPARREGSKRLLDIEAMAPPLSALRTRAAGRDLLVKQAPGLDLEQVPADAGLELVSLAGELKEALLTFGALRRPGPRAVLLPAGAELVRADPELPPRVAPPGAWLYEPDPAVIRAGAVRDLGAQLDAWQLDPRLAYLSGDAEHETPLARRWRVLCHGPFRRKEVTRWVREAGLGRVTVKQRGTPLDPAELERRLPRGSGPPGFLFLARTDAGPLALLAT